MLRLRALQGQCVAITEVSRIVGVPAPLITVPVDDKAQAHLQIQGDDQEPSPRKESRGVGRVLWRLPTNKGRQDCSRDKAAAVKNQQRDEKDMISQTDQIHLQEHRDGLEITSSKRKISSPEHKITIDNHRDFEGRQTLPHNHVDYSQSKEERHRNRNSKTQGLKDGSIQMKNYTQDKKTQDKRNYSEEMCKSEAIQGGKDGCRTDRRSYPQCTKDSPHKHTVNTNLKARISEGLIERAQCPTDGSGTRSVRTGGFGRGTMRMWRIPSCSGVDSSRPGDLCDDHLERKRVVFHREIMTTDDMIF
ncbi:uncharacterized protein LOC134448675 isoform X2 [Engraulis encrasicolus]|uniref:uncharacterized protein LOC134448675 isoform X2 n=1 Tax=Engraulis encrasicolus TaxID=184585 RepID=UPI002FD386EE